MGRIVDFLAEIAAEAEEGGEGLTLSPDGWERFRADWRDEDIEDALHLVHENLLQSELTDAADSLSARMVEVLGQFGSVAGWQQAEKGDARLSLEVIGHLVRRVDRLEEVLQVFRDSSPPDRRGFDALQSHLANRGIETEMESEPDEGGDGDGDGH